MDQINFVENSIGSSSDMILKRGNRQQKFEEKGAQSVNELDKLSAGPYSSKSRHESNEIDMR